jgi:RNA-directed DNA polymerase
LRKSRHESEEKEIGNLTRPQGVSAVIVVVAEVISHDEGRHRERKDNVKPAGRDTFQAKTVRNREAVPPGTTNLPSEGTVKLKQRRVLHSVIDKVFNWNNLKSASRKVVKNKGSAGVDGMSVKRWQEKEESHLQELKWRLMKDSYRSKPVKRCYIPKPGSTKKRPLGIPTVTDRVCQQAVNNILAPVFEQYFHEDSHGFRPGRRRVEALCKQGYSHVVDLDIKGFYDHVDREILMRLVKKVVKDRRVLGLIRGWLKAGVLEEGKVRYMTSGTPQGGVISPLLSNIYLTPLDNALTEAGYRFVRYADDVCIFCRDEEETEKALHQARTVLSGLKLKLNEEKTSVQTFREGFDFLGFRFTRRGRHIAERSLKALYGSVREITKRQQGDKPVLVVIKALEPQLRGWGNYHREGRNVRIFTELDKWIRKRLRSYIYKRWRIFRGPKANRPDREEFERMGLFSLRSILRPDMLQLTLFPAPR